MRKLTILLTSILISVSIFSQTKPVTGIVTNSKGEPVPFATVTETGTKNVVKADANGLFNIKVKTGSQLTVSSSGLASKTISVIDGMNNIQLDIKNEAMQEVIVTTALGVKRQAKELGYATTRISAQELTQAKVTNISSGLAAKVAGLQINQFNNGVVGTNTRVTLRGNRSILGNNQALMVVDDVPVSIDYINSINPNDVDNVTVLKGASASALYGSDASNGVIIITTRRGSKGRPIIKLSNTTTFESVAYMPDFQNRFGAYGGEFEPYDQTLGMGNYVPYENQSYGPEYNGQQVSLGGPVRFFRPDGSYFDSTLKVPYSAIKDGKQNFFERGMTTQTDLSFSTGDTRSKFFLSLQDVRIKGVVPKDENRRKAIRIAGTNEFGIFKVDYSVGYTLTNTDITNDGSTSTFNFGGTRIGSGSVGVGGAYEAQGRPVYWSVINLPQHIDLKRFRDWRNDPFANPNGWINAYYANPWWQIDESRTTARDNALLSNISFSLKPASWISLMYRVGYIRNDYLMNSRKAGFKFEPWAIADPAGAGSIPASVKLLRPTFGEVTGTNSKIVGDFLISMNKEINDFSAKLLLGNTLQKKTGASTAISATSLIIPGLYNITNRVGEPNVGHGIAESGLIGVFGDITLGWRNYLFFHVTSRNDWDSRLSTENRSFFYPSADAAFVFTDAFSFFKASKILNYGKLRVAYSKVGQVNIGPYSLDNTFVTGGGFPFGSTVGYVQNPTINNPDIKPEFTTEKEVGVELGFLNNRINLQAAYFRSKTVDQTLPVSVAPSSGFGSALINTGEMSNNGFEVDLKVTPLLKTKSGFRWDFGGNFTYIDNRVISIFGGVKEIAVGGTAYAIVGEAYPSIKVTDWLRDTDGRVIVDKSTGFPIADPNLKSFGTANWPYKVGLNTSLSYKGLTLTAVADGRFGAVINNAVGGSLDFTGISAHTTQTGRQNFIFPNSVVDDGTGKYIPNTEYSTIDANWRFWANTYNGVGSVYVNSSDFWKLREVSLSYEFPTAVLNRFKWVKAINVALIGRNLVAIRAKDNVWTDPEFNINNGNGTGFTNILQTPPTRIYGASLNVTF